MPTLSRNPFAPDAWRGLVDVTADPGARCIGEPVVAWFVAAAPLVGALCALAALHAVAALLDTLRRRA